MGIIEQLFMIPISFCLGYLPGRLLRMIIGVYERKKIDVV